MGAWIEQVVVTGVTEGGAADKAGIKVHDAIRSVDGVAVTQVMDVANAVAAKKAGDVMTLTVLRGTAEKAEQLTIKTTLAPRPGTEGGKAQAWLGVNLGQIVVLEVAPGSAADKAGIKSADQILAIDKMVMHGAADVANAIAAKKPGDVLAVTVLRDNKQQTINVTLQGEPPSGK